MRDIDVELDHILIKYGILQGAGLESAIKFIEDWEQSLNSNEIIALYGTGQATNNLLYFLFMHGKNIYIDYCFDKNVKKFSYKNRIKSNKVLEIEQIEKIQVDYMIIGSYQYRKEMKLKLKELNFQGKVIDIFELLEEYENNHYRNYKQIFTLKKKYESAEENDKPILLTELIKSYFIIRDFVNAFKYCDDYIENQYSDYYRYEDTKNEIGIFLDKIVKDVDNRSGDIIINWLDAVPYCDRHLFPFLRKKAEAGVDFKNAYTVIPWTSDAMKTILFAEYPIEGKLFLRNEVDYSTPFLALLKKYGYKFSYCGLGRFYKMFSDEVIMPVNIYYDSYTSSVPYQWQAIRLLCQEESPMCILIHSLHETHEPFVSAEGDTCIYMGNQLTDWANENNLKQVESASRYLDAQLKFYESLYGKHATKIYMSDHGRKGNSLMRDYKVHVNLIIDKENIFHEEVEDMFSIINFGNLVEKIITNDTDWNGITSEYVLVQNFDAYNENVIQKALNGELFLQDMLQCRGIITKKDKYFLTANGKEYYYPECGDESQNEIDNEMYRTRILWLKEKCKKEFVDIKKYNKFEYSHLLYSDKAIKVLN